MTLSTHGDLKYRGSQRLGDAAEWPELRVEQRRIEPGVQAELTLECTEIVLLLAGRSGVRRVGDGEAQEALALPGMGWICPAGTHESHVELTAPMECLHIFLPPTLIARSARWRTTRSIPPGPGSPMPEVSPIRCCNRSDRPFRSMMGRGPQPTDELFADGMQAALAAHLLGTYSVDCWQPPSRTPSLDPRRLKRVLDFIEARLADDIALDDLAAEACLSPFHFSRLFREATGQNAAPLPDRAARAGRAGQAGAQPLHPRRDRTRYGVRIAGQFHPRLSQVHRADAGPVSATFCADPSQDPHMRKICASLGRIWKYPPRTSGLDPPHRNGIAIPARSLKGRETSDD